jgi:NAD(P) transhydrogenase subunit alpha
MGNIMKFMKLLVLKEKKQNESRVALTPDLVSKYQKLGFEIFIESGAGEKSLFLDEDYTSAGAAILKDVSSVLPEIDIIISVQDSDFDFSKTRAGVVFIGLLNPHFEKEKIQKLSDHKICAFALELAPRITRAQAMDVLSSQSNLAGYSAVITAVYELSKTVPMMITSAGTISAAKFLILGAGVAGLQAIATAKRLGGIVFAFDVRDSAKEQVQSLGAKFVEVKNTSAPAETRAGYAKEMDDDYKKRQEKAIADSIINQDVVISTALIPGKKAPVLITRQMVESMKKGSIIIDLASINGGNCELTEVGKIVEKNGVKIIGYENFTNKVATDASKLYGKNIFNFIQLLVSEESIKIDLEDEIVKSCLTTNLF